MKPTADVLLYLLIDLVIIIAAARVMGWAARKIGQPAVVGEILAGVLLGPTVLGRIAPGFQADLFPKEVPLRSIADLGLVFFMFLVGLELDTRLVRREGRRALTISLSGVVAPLALGFLLALSMRSVNTGGQFLDGVVPRTEGLAFPLFMGAAMCITAFPVLARILVERGLYKTGLGTAALCAAAVDDVTAWVLLAAVVGIASTGSIAEAGGVLILTAIYAAFMLIVGRWVLRWLARRFEATGRMSVDMVAIIMAGVLLSAFATEQIGIHSIFGAFIFGAIMPKHSRMTRELTDRVEDFTVVVLLPVFFVVSGLRTNLFAINSVELVGWLVLILLVAIAGKLLGCGLAARLNGFSWRDSAIMGSLMNTRGLTELVILSIGLGLGVLSDRTFAMMVIMALVTTFMAAPLINWLLPRKEMVGLLAANPAPEAPPMARRILVALGNPQNARALVDAGIRLTGQQRPAELLFVRLIPTSRAPEFRTGLLDEESQVDTALEALQALVAQAEAAGVSARPVSFLTDDVGKDLSWIAETQGCDTIVLGWHRASLERRVIRALVHRIFRLAPCDVVVFVDRQGQGIVPKAGAPVLVALSASDQDAAALRLGGALGENLDSQIHLVGYLGASAPAASLAAQARQLAAASQRPVEPIPAAEVGVAARESASATVAVVGLGNGWNDKVDFGLPANDLAEQVACPLLVVRGAPAVARPDLPVNGTAATPAAVR